MPNSMNSAQRAFLKGMAEMTDKFRHDIDEPFALIGKATCTLIDQGAPVTKGAIRDIIIALPEGQNADLMERLNKSLGI